MSDPHDQDAHQASALRALEFVENNQRLGLGTGRAANAFVRALGQRVREGLRVEGVPTSDATATLAMELRIPLLTLAEAGTLDTTFDGADEVDPRLDVIKGYGGAHVREKVVASASRQLVILVGEEKLVSKLGERGKLPVEVLPFALTVAGQKLIDMGCEPTQRLSDAGGPFISDNDNYVLDCRVSAIDDPARLDAEILAIPGVVGTGLFVGMADAVVVERADGVEVLER